MEKGGEGKCAKDQKANQISQKTLVPKIEIVIQHTIYDPKLLWSPLTAVSVVGE